MKMRRWLLALFVFTMILLAIVGLIKVNIINTRALSPLGTTNDNYEMVKEEFGEDFSDFIKDSSPIKIYVDDSKETLVKINDKDYIIKSESSIVTVIKNIFGGVFDFFAGIKGGIDDFSNELNGN